MLSSLCCHVWIILTSFLPFLGTFADTKLGEGERGVTLNEGHWLQSKQGVRVVWQRGLTIWLPVYFKMSCEKNFNLK